MSTSNTPHREIERKFLLLALPENLASFPHREIEQGYLAVGANGIQVRLRRAGDAYSLTYKRDAAEGRIEREVDLTPEQFAVLWPATEGMRLSKRRYDVAYAEFVIEIDIYTGRHEGLVVAEVEFSSVESARRFHPPSWFGEDVTGSPRYSNVRLAAAQ
jgi:adenylate cyclase